MAGHADEHERTIAFAEIALGQIKALRQAATPRNYEIWYAYATGYYPSLNQMINDTLKKSGVLTEVFACGTAAVITPVGEVKFEGGGWQINNRQTGPVAQSLRDAMLAIQHGTAPDTHGFMHRVL